MQVEFLQFFRENWIKKTFSSGLAVAYASKVLGMPSVTFVPETTTEIVIEKIKVRVNFCFCIWKRCVGSPFFFALWLFFSIIESPHLNPFHPVYINYQRNNFINIDGDEQSVEANLLHCNLYIKGILWPQTYIMNHSEQQKDFFESTYELKLSLILSIAASFLGKWKNKFLQFCTLKLNINL